MNNKEAEVGIGKCDVKNKGLIVIGIRTFYFNGALIS
jgi:hypothetical protein